MNRWSSWRVFWIAASFALASLFVHQEHVVAQSVNTVQPEQIVKRSFPPGTMRGKLIVQQPPVVTLNGVPDRLSPGARIRNERNMLTLSAGLVGLELTVNYRRDAAGLIHDVWIVTALEAADKLPGSQPVTNIRIATDDEQAPSGDGKTPHRLLPGYPR